MNEQLKKIKDYFIEMQPTILWLSIIANISLIWAIHELPGHISDAVKSGAGVRVDTVRITNKVTETAAIQNTSNFLFFQGTIVSDAIKYSENYSYIVTMPSEIYDGYLTRVKSYGGAEYFMWSKNKVLKPELSKDLEIRGWFVTDNITKLQRGEQYLQTLYPIVEKRVSSSDTSP